MRLLLAVWLFSSAYAGQFDSFSLGTTMVPMRDGVRLSTDVYRPARGGNPADGKFPVIVTRSPYNKSGERRKGIYFARCGYVFVAQDVRGRYASEGEFQPLLQEGADGYDAIEWAAAQPWSDGRVGTVGASYLALDQYAAAIERPPHLVAMFAAVGGSSFYHDNGYPGGMPNLGWAVWLLNMAASSPRIDAAGKKRLAAVTNDPEAWLAQSARKREDVFVATPGLREAYQSFYDHPDFSGFWQQKGLEVAAWFNEMKDVPMFFLSGWYDNFSDGTLANFSGLRRAHKSMKKVLMGPWPHGFGKAECGDAVFPPSAALDEHALEMDWFEHWFRQRPFTIVKQAPVEYFRMGGGPGVEEGKLHPGGEWRTAASWPPPNAKPRRFYLRSEGALSSAAPQADEAAASYRFDPAHPLRPAGGTRANSCIQRQPESGPAGVLSFSSAPLDKAIDLSGAARASLWVSSDTTSADFTLRLIDVYPDGYAMNLSDGQLRVALEPGQPRNIAIEIGSTSNLFVPGHRLRLDISSSNYPHFEPNPHAGQHSVYHDRRRPSYIELTSPR